MKLIQEIVSESIRGFRGMLFPEVCVCCGTPALNGSDLLCSFCQEEKFDPAMPSGGISCPGVILPEDVMFQYALWKFDKGGSLQKLLHLVKYAGYGKLAYEMGQLTGISFAQSELYELCNPEHTRLLPVPLHPRKKRIRGFNQAEVIADGFSEATGIPVLTEEIIKRAKYTYTQTSRDLDGRMKNLENVFVVSDPGIAGIGSMIIIDDVFTTGATAYSLTRELRKSGVHQIGIVTVAFA